MKLPFDVCFSITRVLLEDHITNPFNQDAWKSVRNVLKFTSCSKMLYKIRGIFWKPMFFKLIPHETVNVPVELNSKEIEIFWKNLCTSVFQLRFNVVFLNVFVSLPKSGIISDHRDLICNVYPELSCTKLKKFISRNLLLGETRILHMSSEKYIDDGGHFWNDKKKGPSMDIYWTPIYNPTKKMIGDLSIDKSNTNYFYFCKETFPDQKDGDLPFMVPVSGKVKTEEDLKEYFTRKDIPMIYFDFVSSFYF
jgi:hypothetical protein